MHPAYLGSACKPKRPLLALLGLRSFALLYLLAIPPTFAQDDDFEWFRCDACSASFFKINKTLVEKLARRSSVPEFEFLEIVEEVCDSMFTKHEYGVKQHEGKKYLFGPGVTDHIPNQGFGQMGMGDYDKRLAAYCKMFVEDVGEEKAQELFSKDKQLNHTELCRNECKSSASGTGAQSRKPRTSKQPRKSAQPDAPKKKQKPEEKDKKGAKQIAAKSDTKKAKTNSKQPEDSQKTESTTSKPSAAQSESPATGLDARSSDKAAQKLEEALASFPEFTDAQLQRLGVAVMGELASRAHNSALKAAAARSEL